MQLAYRKLFLLILFIGCEDTDITRYAPSVGDEYQISETLPVPTLFGGKFIESPGYGLHWTESAPNTMYQLVSSFSDSFPSSSVVYQGPNREITVSTNTLFYKVRAYSAGYASHWSNSVKP